MIFTSHLKIQQASQTSFFSFSVSEIGVKKIFDDLIEQIETQLKKPDLENVESDPEVYDFQHQVRGFGIVISIENFPHVKPRLRRRPHAQPELNNMHKALTSLEFQVLLFTDLTTEQIVNVLTEAATRKEVNKKADTFACVIGSHGKDESSNNTLIDEASGELVEKKGTINLQPVIFGTDGTIPTRKLISLFEDKACQELKDKPKLFFIQACRKRDGYGDSYDEGVDIIYERRGTDERTNNNSESLSEEGEDVEERGSPDIEENDDTDETDNTDSEYSSDEDRDVEEKGSISPSTEENMFKNCKKRKKKRIAVYLPYCPIHFCVIYSVADGYISFGRESVGGWMLYAFYDVIRQNPEKDFLAITTEVCNMGAKFEARKKKSGRVAKAAIAVEHRLTKSIDFKKK